MAPDPAFAPHFVDVGGRLVHYARGGAGPAVAMVHGSPQSHRALLPLARRLAGRFTVFAFDTPGYGASDPLPGQPGIAGFGDALVETLAALGLGPVPVYGTHTGASIALEAANRHPQIVSRAVLDGFAMFTAAEREDLMREHMPPIGLEWDGSHLAALWSKVRDQAVFFPWFRRGSSGRRTTDPAPLELHHQALLDFLHAGPDYPVAYGASICHDTSALTLAPDRVRLFVRRSDVLFDHLARVPAGFAHARAVDADADAAIADSLAEAASSLAPDTIEPPGRCYVHGLHWRTIGRGPALVLLHDLPGSAETAWNEARRLAAMRTVLVPDLPGWGLSPPVAGQDRPELVADLIAGAVRGLGHDSAEVAGIGAGGILAPLVARRLGGPRADTIDPLPAMTPEMADRYLVDVSPRWDGAHLLAAWYRQRDALLFRPWFDRRTASGVALGPDVDLAALQVRVTAMLEASGPDITRSLLLHPSRRTAPCA